MSLPASVSLWPIIFFQALLTYVVKAGRAIAIIVAFLAWFTGLADRCMTEVISQFNLLFAQTNMGGLKPAGGVDFNLVESIGYINAFLPVGEFLGLLNIYLIAWCTIIIIRWTKSVIPTMSN